MARMHARRSVLCRTSAPKLQVRLSEGLSARLVPVRSCQGRLLQRAVAPGDATLGKSSARARQELRWIASLPSLLYAVRSAAQRTRPPRCQESTPSRGSTPPDSSSNAKMYVATAQVMRTPRTSMMTWMVVEACAASIFIAESSLRPARIERARQPREAGVWAGNAGRGVSWLGDLAPSSRRRGAEAPRRRRSQGQHGAQDNARRDYEEERRRDGDGVLDRRLESDHADKAGDDEYEGEGKGAAQLVRH